MSDGIPEPPDNLSDASKRIWRAYAELYSVTIADIPLYELFCDSYSRYQELMESVKQFGLLMMTDKGLKANPALARADKEAANFKHALRQMMANKSGEQNDADDYETPAAEVEGIEAVREKLLALFTAEGEDDEGAGSDRKPPRRRTSKPKAKVKAPRARQVRAKEESGSGQAASQEPEAS